MSVFEIFKHNGLKDSASAAKSNEPNECQLSYNLSTEEVAQVKNQSNFIRDYSFPEFVRRTNEKMQTIKFIAEFIEMYIPQNHSCRIADIGYGDGNLTIPMLKLVSKRCNGVHFDGIDRSEKFRSALINSIAEHFDNNDKFHNLMRRHIYQRDYFSESHIYMKEKYRFLMASQVGFYAPDFNRFLSKILEKIDSLGIVILQSDHSFLNVINTKYSAPLQSKNVFCEKKLREFIPSAHGFHYSYLHYHSKIILPEFDYQNTSALLQIIQRPFDHYVTDYNSTSTDYSLEFQIRNILEFVAGAPLDFLRKRNFCIIQEFVKDVQAHIDKTKYYISFWNFMAIIAKSGTRVEGFELSNKSVLFKIKHSNLITNADESGMYPIDAAINEGNFEILESLAQDDLPDDSFRLLISELVNSTFSYYLNLSASEFYFNNNLPISSNYYTHCIQKKQFANLRIFLEYVANFDNSTTLEFNQISKHVSPFKLLAESNKYKLPIANALTLFFACTNNYGTATQLSLTLVQLFLWYNQDQNSDHIKSHFIPLQLLHVANDSLSSSFLWSNYIKYYDLDLNAQNFQRETLLNLACASNLTEFVINHLSQLIEQIAIPNSKGLLPIHWTVLNSNQYLYKTLMNSTDCDPIINKSMDYYSTSIKLLLYILPTILIYEPHTHHAHQPSPAIKIATNLLVALHSQGVYEVLNSLALDSYDRNLTPIDASWDEKICYTIIALHAYQIISEFASSFKSNPYHVSAAQYFLMMFGFNYVYKKLMHDMNFITEKLQHNLTSDTEHDNSPIHKSSSIDFATPLNLATMHRDSMMISTIIKNCPINLGQYTDHLSPVHLAAYNHDYESLKLLITIWGSKKLIAHTDFLNHNISSIFILPPGLSPYHFALSKPAANTSDLLKTLQILADHNSSYYATLPKLQLFNTDISWQLIISIPLIYILSYNLCSENIINYLIPSFFTAAMLSSLHVSLAYEINPISWFKSNYGENPSDPNLKITLDILQRQVEISALNQNEDNHFDVSNFDALVDHFIPVIQILLP